MKQFFSWILTNRSNKDIDDDTDRILIFLIRGLYITHLFFGHKELYSNENILSIIHVIIIRHVIRAVILQKKISY